MQEDEISASPVLAPKQKDAPKEEPVDNSPLKPISAASARASSASKSAKGKRKVSTDDAKAAAAVPSKKAKTENVRFCNMFVQIYS